MDRVKNFMGTSAFKVLLLLFLILLFLIPVTMIRDIIYERSYRAGEAEQDIMSSWGEEFIILGPVLRIPCKERLEIKSKNEKGEEKGEIRESWFSLWVVPEKLAGDVTLGTEIKRRGIFSVPLFAGKARLSGSFDTSNILKELNKDQTAFPAEAELVISLASQRGIRGIEQGLWNGKEIEFLPGNQGFALKNGQGGIHGSTPVNLAAGNEGQIPFDITMTLQGGKALRMIPIGGDSRFSVKADWASPSFQGSYLPVSHSITDEGFEAQWEVSHLSRNIPLIWTRLSDASDLGDNRESQLASAMFAVNFYKVLDHYDVNTRAVKYALLFIIIPFLSLFLFEIFQRRPIHPVQYLLSGIGNVIFYLLLLSFSEHIPFPPAYWISALAVTCMMTLYSRSLLGSWKKSPIMAVVMLLCYTFLYFTLQSEDWALLIGSLGAFGITGAVMFLTRKLDLPE